MGAAVRRHQGPDGQVLQIVEVQHPAAALGLLVGRLKGRHQPEQLLYRLPHCRQVPQQRGAVPGEPLRHLGHLLFALVPQPLHLLPQADIFYFPGRLQLIETDACLAAAASHPCRAASRKASILSRVPQKFSA